MSETAFGEAAAASEAAWLREDHERRRLVLSRDWHGHDPAAMLRALYEWHNVDEYGADRGDGTYGLSGRKLRLFARACRESFYGTSWRALGESAERDERAPAAHAARCWASELAVSERPRRAAFLRDIAGDPFGPAPSLGLAHLPAEAAALALAADALLEGGERSPLTLRVLADCLEEAGAAGAVLAHLRSPGPHVAGCWAVDLVLGRK